MPETPQFEAVTGPYRVLELDGRRGVNPLSIHTSLRVGGHRLSADYGAITLWFFALEDLGASFIEDHMRIDNPHFANYAFLSDNPVARDVGETRFSLVWLRQNELRAQFFRGSIHREGFELPQKAYVHAVPFNIVEKHKWYQIALTWDAPARDYRLYVNGILVATSDRYCLDQHRETPGDTLYAGCPALCHGEIRQFSHTMDADEVYKQFRDGVTKFDEDVERQLRHTWGGQDVEPFHFEPDAGWDAVMDSPLTEGRGREEWYVQGEADSVKWGARRDGLLVETPDVTFEPKNRGRQVYLWSEAMVEGDVCLEFDFKTLARGGLALLMFHATGMTREDFMADYPRKTTGKMITVHGENVRNYHWEFYREMHDVRNDVASSFSRKNNFAFRNGFGCLSDKFPVNEWVKVQLVQQGGHVVGALRGRKVLEFTDNSRTNTGGILTGGHIALRVMLHSKVMFRHLKVWSRRPPFEVVERYEGPAESGNGATARWL